jgi:4'-phosphopantetheinyl transferase
VTDPPVPPGRDERGQPLLTLWRAPLDLPAPAFHRLTDSLSDEERQRGDRYRHRQDRERFLAGRGWLRRLLARQLRCDPENVRIWAEPGQKPRLEAGNLRFNASRSAGLALFVTSWKAEVGVDIEAIRASADVEGIATTYFSPDEQRALSALPPTQRLAASFQCWTCKEAYVKGIGRGIDFPLDTVDVWLADGQPATVTEWTIHQVHIAAGFAAAVAGWRYDELPPNVQTIRAPDLEPLPATIDVETFSGE